MKVAKHKNSKKNIKENKKIENVVTNEKDIWGVVFLVFAVIIFLGLFYLLTLYITHKNSTDSSSDDTKTEESTTISYDKILIGNSLSMSDDDYYVLFYDTSDEDISNVYSDLYNNYKNNTEHLTIYYVDMGSAFNKGYTTDGDSNKNPSNEAEFLINGPTLIKVSGNKVVEYIEGRDDITNALS